jgi:hypothetical protein
MANEAEVSAASLEIIEAGGDLGTDMRVMFSVLTLGIAQQFFSDLGKVRRRRVFWGQLSLCFGLVVHFPQEAAGSNLVYASSH